MILIYGKGKVGLGLAKLCEHLNQSYTICDDSDAPSDLSRYTHIIPSPGVPSTHDIYRHKGIVCELDFVAEHIPDGFTKICVTGTDGKSTTCHIAHQIIQQSGIYEHVYLTGNNDESLSTTLLGILQRNEQHGVLVIEVSSFMAYALKIFTSHITLLTNLHPDHLDWHKDLEEYYQSKMQLIYMTTDSVILNHAIFDTVSEFETLSEDIISINDPAETSAQVNIPMITLGDEMFDSRETPFSGIYNATNLLMGMLAASKVNVSACEAFEYAKNISPLAHRIEEIYVSDDNIHWIEDSKSTTSQSQKAALSSMPEKKTILIAGGKDKGDSFEGIQDFWDTHCHHLIFIGETKHMLSSQARNSDVNHTLCETLKEAVDLAFEIARPGDHVLFSPGCSSFDMFDNYLDRAHQFRDLVSLKKV